MTTATVFGYAPDLADRYPSLATASAVFTADGSPTGGADPGRAWLDDAAAAARRHLDGRAAADLPEVQAWRNVFASFGATPSKHRSAVEALQRRVARGHDVPSINPLVDAANAVSLHHRVPVALFDLAALVDRITVRFADGGEVFAPIGPGDDETAEPGEVVFTDPADRCWARRWCWRQSATGAATATTGRLLAVIEAHHDGAQEATAAALDDLTARLGTVGTHPV